MSPRKRWLVALGIIIGVSGRAEAQSTAGTFEHLQLLVTPGNTIAVHETAGDVTATATSRSRSFQELSLVSPMVIGFCGVEPVLLASNERRASNGLSASVETEISRLVRAAPDRIGPSSAVRQSSVDRRNWIQRHPVLFGTMAGFGGGFLIGYLPGDDGVFYDFSADFVGLVFGGIGAGAGALVGWGASR